ncbi:hypothetical protein [Prauserella flavalba]|uniref:hypothetical protein n=1 Tax=Prauserella flavalba TaxID=1477506 RepID=UPI0036E5DE6F
MSTGSQSTVDTTATDVTRLQWMNDEQLGYLGQRHLDSVAGIIDVTTGQVRELFSTETAYGRVGSIPTARSPRTAA